MKKVIIDCDPGADDILLLLFALGCPELDVLAVTIVAGNRRAELCAQNALKILEYCHRTDIPVYIGAEQPLVRVLPKDDIYSGRDGMAEMFLPYSGTLPQKENAVDKLIELATANTGEVYIVSTGPMTNLAMAIVKHPAFIEQVKEVVTINGSYGVAHDPHRVDSRIEWNVLVDPEAAKCVMESGIKITALGIDITGKLTNDLHHRLIASSTAGTVPRKMLEDAEQFLRGRGLEPSGLYVDVIAAAYLVEPELASFVEGSVAVEIHGEITTGYTRFDNVGNIKNHSNIRVAYHFDMNRFETLLHERAFR